MTTAVKATAKNIKIGSVVRTDTGAEVKLRISRTIASRCSIVEAINAESATYARMQSHLTTTDQRR